MPQEFKTLKGTGTSKGFPKGRIIEDMPAEDAAILIKAGHAVEAKKGDKSEEVKTSSIKTK